MKFLLKAVLFLCSLVNVSCSERKLSESDTDSASVDVKGSEIQKDDANWSYPGEVNRPLVFTRNAKLYSKADTLSDFKETPLGTSISLIGLGFYQREPWYKASIESNKGYIRARDVAKYSYINEDGKVIYVFGPTVRNGVKPDYEYTSNLIKCTINFEKFLDTLTVPIVASLHLKKVESIQLSNVDFVLGYAQIFEMGTGQITGYIIDANDSLFVLTMGGGGGESMAGETVTIEEIFLPILKDGSLLLLSEIPFNERAYSKKVNFDIKNIVVKSFNSFRYDSLTKEPVSIIDDKPVFYRWNGRKLVKNQ